MKPKLLLHVGTHKTGTTAIQQCLAENRDLLTRHRLHYPTLPERFLGRKDQHHIWAHGIAGKSEKLQKIDAQAIAKEWETYALETGCTTLISAEPIWRHTIGDNEDSWLSERAAYLKAVAEVLQDFDVEVLIVFRKPDNFIRSLFLENLYSSRSGLDPNFRRFIDRSLGTVLRYGDNANAFRAVFGSVKCATYESLAKDNLALSFLNWIGVGCEGVVDPGQVRTSLPVWRALLVNEIKRRASKGPNSKQVYSVLSEIEATAAGEKYRLASEGKDVWWDRDAKRELLECVRGQIEVLESNFGLDCSDWRNVDEATCAPEVPSLPESLLNEIQSHLRLRSRSTIFERFLGKHK